MASELVKQLREDIIRGELAPAQKLVWILFVPVTAWAAAQRAKP